MQNGKPIIRLEHISKNFGRVEALSSVDAIIKENETLAIVGDNGAGKSTLINILTGNLSPDDGKITIKGDPVDFETPSDARHQGIGVVYQDLALVDSLSVAENVFLGNYPKKDVGGLPLLVDWEYMHEKASDTISKNLNLDLNPNSRVELLSGGERQVVAIARALVSDPEVVVLDEPTAKLSETTIDQVQELIQELKSTGHTIVVIEHNIDQVIKIADRILVLHNGNKVGTFKSENIDKDEVISMMISGENSKGEQAAPRERS